MPGLNRLSRAYPALPVERRCTANVSLSIATGAGGSSEPSRDPVHSGYPDMARRRLGQHFLKDASVAARVVAAADLTPGDTVVEVGPGRGALTRRLAGKVARLILVEVDSGLAAGLRERYADDGSVEVIEADARLLDVAEIPGLRGGAYKMGGKPARRLGEGWVGGGG